MSNLPPSKGEVQEIALQPSPGEETCQDPQPDANISRSFEDTAEDAPETVSDDDVNERMRIAEVMGHLVENITHGPAKIAMNELRVCVLCALADVLESDFKCSGRLVSIEKAVECRRQVLSISNDGHASRGYQLGTLGTTLLHRFKQLGDPEDIDKAIQHLSQAVRLTPDGHSHHLTALSNLSASYQCRFERFGEPTDLDQAIQCQIRAEQLTPDGHPDKVSTLNDLGLLYQSRFERLGELADLDQAIQYQTQAVQFTPDGSPDMPGKLSLLGISYMRQFEYLGEFTGLNQGIQCFTQAMQLTPDGHSEKPLMLNNLGNSYLRRFELLGELTDLDQGIQCHTQTVQQTPDGHPDKPAWLSNLGISHQFRFERLGELANVDQAIQCQTQAVQLTHNNHPDKPNWFNNLGVAYMRRFERLSELSDLEQGIWCQIEALQLTPDSHPEKPKRLNNLGSSYQNRFERLNEIANLDQAIQCQTQAVKLTLDGHPDKPAMLTNLGNSYQSRFEHLDEHSDVDQAILCHTQAVLLTPDGHLNKPGMLINLGISYRIQFERHGELFNVDQAIRCQSQAVQLTPDGHRDKPVNLNHLGRSYESRGKSRKHLPDHEFALSCFEQAAQLPVTNPQTQLASARQWANACIVLGRSPQEAYERSIELLPHVVWLGAIIDKRYDILTSIGDLAIEAASWAISVQDYDLAIEWLEQGRSIVWNQILQLRTPLDALWVHAPALAQRLKDIASQLEHASLRTAAPDDQNSMNFDLEKMAQHHRHLAAEWGKCLEEARNLPGFGNFMRPRKASELKAAATDGPVVLINTHSTRWDALIIFPRRDDVVHLPLITPPPKEVGESDARLSIEYVPCHRGGRAGGFGRVKHGSKLEDPFKAELTALWEAVVKPILEALGCTLKLPVDKLSRVTWCATGPLALAPLHAAGAYDGSSPNAFDLVISSYTPSLSALLASSTSTSQSDVGVLAIGQDDTKGFPPLPYTSHELAAIKTHTQRGGFLQLDGKNATVEAVLGAIDEHSWVHLACHATQDPVNPSHSAFHLHDGHLTLEAITNRRFENKGLAYLSACQTAKGDGKLPDEAVHLAAGMLMAGYPSVIATMWSISDIDGPEVAGRVYAELLKDGTMNHRGAARALHKAVAELREKIGIDSFKRWVPFIHIGV